MVKRRRRRKKVTVSKESCTADSNHSKPIGLVSIPPRPRGFGNSCLDKLWSAKVKELASHKCEICGSTEKLEAHHIHRCKHYGVRWNVINGACLCWKCHQKSDYSAHKNSLYFFREMIRRRGDDWGDELIRATVEDKNWRERLFLIKEKLQ